TAAARRAAAAYGRTGRRASRPAAPPRPASGCTRRRTTAAGRSRRAGRWPASAARRSARSGPGRPRAGSAPAHPAPTTGVRPSPTPLESALRTESKLPKAGQLLFRGRCVSAIDQPVEGPRTGSEEPGQVVRELPPPGRPVVRDVEAPHVQLAVDPPVLQQPRQ